MFLKQFVVNKVKPSKLADLFVIRQQETEPLRDYLNRFCNNIVKINPPNEEMFVDAFVKGLRANPFSESLLRERVKFMTEVCRRATTHIEAEEVMKGKRAKERRPRNKYNNSIREGKFKPEEERNAFQKEE